MGGGAPDGSEGGAVDARGAVDVRALAGEEERVQARDLRRPGAGAEAGRRPGLGGPGGCEGSRVAGAAHRLRELPGLVGVVEVAHGDAGVDDAARDGLAAHFLWGRRKKWFGVGTEARATGSPQRAESCWRRAWNGMPRASRQSSL